MSSRNSDRHEPQWVPAWQSAPICSTVVRPLLSMASTRVLRPTLWQAQTTGPVSSLLSAARPASKSVRSDSSPGAPCQIRPSASFAQAVHGRARQRYRRVACRARFWLPDIARYRHLRTPTIHRCGRVSDVTNGPNWRQPPHPPARNDGTAHRLPGSSNPPR
jgi:hypothetical protein